MASAATKEFREKIAQEFIKSLQEEELDWKKQWKGLSAPVNGVTGKQYKGINRFWLSIMMQEFGWEDNRFLTFWQIQKQGWKLDAGSKGLKVEYWYPFDKEEKKALTWSEYKELIKGMNQEEIDDRFTLAARYYTVFNGSMIKGIPELDRRLNDVKGDDLIKNISDGMRVEILNDGGDKAFYRPSEDKIHLPVAGAFDSEYAYNSTALHELGHATGAPQRLNRPLCGFFGSEDYAKEELVAEITSAFMSVHLGEGSDTSDISNHKAYIQSWIQAIKEKPESLFEAIKQAELASDYMEKAAGLKKEKEEENEEEKFKER